MGASGTAMTCGMLTMTANDGLAPARCPGLVSGL
eukprot:SAG11_NODE_36699_length_260_cov_0.931677_1_plen_33_part_01